MTMQMFYIWQLIGILCAYFGVTIVLPAIAFQKKFEGQNIIKKVVFCFLFGNYYVMNLVFLLELMHISCKVTLIIGTIVPFLIYSNIANRWRLRKRVVIGFSNFAKLMGKRIGRKTLAIHRRERMLKQLRKQKEAIKATSFLERVDVIIFLISFVFIIIFYGITIVRTYGYSASDLPVHNYWINALGENKLFVAGIYPEGAHCVEYYLHEVFGFDTYIILSLFGFIQATCIVYEALFFLKLICKNRFLPYLGFAVYVCTNIWTWGAYARLYSALPQEFGMMFILPAVYYGFEFFRVQHEERKKRLDAGKIKITGKENISKVNTGKKNLFKKWKEFIKKPYFIPLCGFCMSFGMTFMVHFYNTIILGICCVAMAIAYFGLFIKKDFWPKILATCGISLLIAILPMVIMFATGTKLQSSLRWGMNIIKGTLSSGVSAPSDTTNMDYYATDGSNYSYADTATMDVTYATEEEAYTTADSNYSGNAVGTVSSENSHQKVNSPINKLANRAIGFFNGIIEATESKNNAISYLVNLYLFNSEHPTYYIYILISIGVLLVVGSVYHVIKDRCTGSMYWTVMLCQLFLLLMLGSDSIGLPTLMDHSRCSIYNMYFVPITAVVAIDSVISFILLIKSNVLRNITDIAGIVGIIGFAIIIIKAGYTQEIKTIGAYESNEAITCLTNIINTQKDDTWTIMSINDETQMVNGHGYHYETTNFLHEIENLDGDTSVYIPTEKIFVFIEKYPLNYAGGYYGDYISEEYAENSLPSKYLVGTDAYSGANRTIFMSHIYYWAQAFMQMYPNDMQVYFEDDKFVCYEITQNTYRQFDLAIDYGYNTENQ